NFEIVVFGILMVLLLQRTREGIWPWLARLFPDREPPRLDASAQAGAGRTETVAQAPLLVIDKARKEFGGLVAVHDLRFAIRRGEILGLIGPNGAGKSTMFNLISGALEPTRGSIVFRGETLTGLAPHAIARLGIGRSFQHAHLIGAMSVLDNVALGAYRR